MARIKLDLEPDPEINVIGISSHVKEYRLCWSLNRALEIELTKRRQGIQEMLNGRAAVFSAYDHLDEETNSNCTLVNNHGSEGVLLRELRQADFFLVIDDERNGSIDEVLRKVRSAEFVLTAFPMNFAQLRDGHKLLL